MITVCFIAILFLKFLNVFLMYRYIFFQFWGEFQFYNIFGIILHMAIILATIIMK